MMMVCSSLYREGIVVRMVRRQGHKRKVFSELLSGQQGEALYVYI